MAAQVTAVSGFVGGVVATILMTLVTGGLQRGLGERSSLPTAVFWARYVSGGDPGDAAIPGLLLHLLYGGLAGLILTLIVSPLYLGIVTVGTLVAAAIAGAVWGLLLFVVGAVVWLMIILGIQPDRRRGAALLIGHLVYGIALGAWIVTMPTL